MAYHQTPFVPIDWAQAHPFAELAKRFGTPFYLYDLPTLRRRVLSIRTAFGPDVELYYAMKSNPNPALLQAMREETLADGVDIASLGEWNLARSAGWSPSQLSYAGPAKSRDSLKETVSSGLGTLCIESLEEFRLLLDLQKKHEIPASLRPRLMFRINPNQLFHAFGLQISGIPSPFGIDEETRDTFLQELEPHRAQFEFLGIHGHVGSQCFSANAMAKSFSHTVTIAEHLHEQGWSSSIINFGGGFGVSHTFPERTIGVGSVAYALRDLQRGSPLGFRSRIEPGRFLIAQAGIFVAKTLRIKSSRNERFCVLDGGMHQYYAGSSHETKHLPHPPWVLNLSHPKREPTSCQLVGPLCTPRDRMGTHLPLSTPEPGDLLGWPNAGAYGLTTSPLLFLSHNTPPEILFDGETYHLIRPSLSPQHFLHNSTN